MAIGNEVCAGATCVENSVLEAVGDITTTIEQQLNTFENICGRSKMLLLASSQCSLRSS